jgi:hypothetical protein
LKNIEIIFANSHFLCGKTEASAGHILQYLHFLLNNTFKGFQDYDNLKAHQYYGKNIFVKIKI